MRRSDWSSDVCSSDLFETSMRAFVRSAFISSVSTSLPSRRSLGGLSQGGETRGGRNLRPWDVSRAWVVSEAEVGARLADAPFEPVGRRSEEHTSELQ